MRLWYTLFVLAMASAVRAAVVDDPLTDLAASPGGRTLALVARGDVWLWDTSKTAARRVTTEGGVYPAFDATGRWLYFSHREHDNTDLYRVPTGQGRTERLTNASASEIQPAPSPDGRSLACARYDGADYAVFLIRDGSAERISPSSEPARRPRWSPDGDRLVYERVHNGRWFVAVYDPRARQERILAATAAERPAFRADGSLWALCNRRLCQLDAMTGEVIGGVDGRMDAFAWAGDEALYFLRGGRLYRLEGVREVACAPQLPWNAADEYRRDCRRVAEEHYRHETARRKLWERYTRAEERRILGATSSRDYDARMAELFWHRPSARAPVSGRQYLVAAAHPLAAHSGERILTRGGNVVDAAIATGFTLCVVEPDGSGIGGEGLINLYLAGMSEPVVIDGRSTAPLRAHPDQPGLRESDGGWARYGPMSACTPGLVAAYYHAWEHYGSGNVPWAELVADAIHYASEGFALSERQAREIAGLSERLARDPGCRRVFFFADGKALRAGDRLRNPELAWTLSQVAERGHEGFYAGPVAARLDAHMRAAGGLLRADDLALYRAWPRRPVAIACFGCRVYASGPPSAGSRALLSMLEELERGPRLSAPYSTDPETFLQLARIMQTGYRRMSGVADPRFWEPPSAPARDSGHTTHLTVMDATGNAVALTQTLGYFFGSRHMVEGTGILLNNEIKNFHTRIGEPDCLLPLARPATTPCPTLFLEGADGGPLRAALAVGSAGGAAIPSSVFLSLVGVLEYGRDVQSALEAPRFLVNRGTERRISLEHLFSPQVEAAVRRELGVETYTISQRGLINEAFCNMIRRHPLTGELEGGVDSRRDGAVVGR